MSCWKRLRNGVYIYASPAFEAMLDHALEKGTVAYIEKLRLEREAKP